MEKNERKINNITFVFMLVVAGFIDLIGFGLNWLPFVGWIIIWIMNVPVWLMFYVWFKTKGVNFSSSKKMLSFGGGFLLELIPVINALPVWTLSIILVVLSDRAEEIIGKMGVPEIAGKIGTQGGAPKMNKTMREAA